MKTAERIGAAFLSLALVSCAAPLAKAPSSAHLTAEDQPATPGTVPPPVRQTLTLPPPRPTPKAETYSVVVNNVQVHDLLFALARDARINVDVHPGITGTVTLNAIDQTLPQLLSRISKQVDMRWEMDGPNLAVMPDSPYLHHYQVDYVNMSRDAIASIQVNGEIGDATLSAGSQTSTAGNTSSSTRISSQSKNKFWETLVGNIKDLLRETDKILPEGSSETIVEQSAAQSTNGVGSVTVAQGQRTARSEVPVQGSQQAEATRTVRHVTYKEAASVISNPEAGVLSVRATAKQHDKVQEFLERVIASARRQVLIEATIVEVTLSQNYQQGIDWGRFRLDATRSGIIGAGFNNLIGSTGGAQLVLGRAADGTADGAIRLLEQFGNAKVLSSPKISVINNQTAVLKVVDNLVYFEVKVESNQNTNTTTTNTTTTPRTASIGFVMSVTPQISDNNTILMSVRPSITRLLRFVRDPNPQLTNVPNEVPELRTREMESVMRVEDGSIAVMGGLMEDIRFNEDRTVPLLGKIPLIGALFTQRDDSVRKSELVVFIRPVVIREANIRGDYKAFKEQLPGSDFFNQGFTHPKYQVGPTSRSGALQ